MKTWLFAAGLSAVLGVAPAIADPIEGAWRTQSGTTAAIDPCGGAFCIVLKDGKYAGKHIGRLKRDGAAYAGQVTDPKTDKTYSGKASVNGASMTLKGCVLGGLFCRGETWTRPTGK